MPFRAPHPSFVSSGRISRGRALRGSEKRWCGTSRRRPGGTLYHRLFRKEENWHGSRRHSVDIEFECRSRRFAVHLSTFSSAPLDALSIAPWPNRKFMLKTGRELFFRVLGALKTKSAHFRNEYIFYFRNAPQQRRARKKIHTHSSIHSFACQELLLLALLPSPSPFPRYIYQFLILRVYMYISALRASSTMHFQPSYTHLSDVATSL